MSSATAPVELHLYQLHPTQERIRAEARRYNIVAAGRRSGKTTLGSDLVVETVLDDAAPCGWFTPTYKNLEETWQQLKNLLRPIATRISESLHRIEVLGGGKIECWSLESEDIADAVRGRFYKRIIVDEAGLVGGLLGIWNRVLRPMLADLHGDAWFLGSPRGFNDFHTLWQRGQDPLQGNWASWQLPIETNPWIDPEEIAEIKADTPEDDYNQEYGAQFLSAGAVVFRKVTEACTAAWQDGRIDGHQYVMGVDWGKVDDFTVLDVIDTTLRQECHIERFNKIDYHFQKGRLAILAAKFQPQLVIAEANSIGIVNLEDLHRMPRPLGDNVFGWEATHASKKAVVEGLSLAIERRDIALLPDKIATGEMLAYTIKRTPSGMITYSAPEGGHDDTVTARALAWLGACAPDARPRQREFRVEA